jgi:hypothetical protein
MARKVFLLQGHLAGDQKGQLEFSKVATSIICALTPAWLFEGFFRQIQKELFTPSRQEVGCFQQHQESL